MIRKQRNKVDFVNFIPLLCVGYSRKSGNENRPLTIMDSLIMENSEIPRIQDIKVRKALMPGDLGRIATIHGELYSEEYGYGLNFEAYVLKGLSEFAQAHDASNDQVWICEHADQCAGCLFAQHREDAIQLRYFILLPKFRGIGLGKKLMSEFMAFYNSSSYERAYLWTTDEQQSATFLYEKYGFILTEEKKSDAFDKVLTERKYELTQMR